MKDVKQFNFKECKQCGKKTREVNFIGKPYENVKLFDSECLDCGYYYIFRINTKTKSYSRTGNLQYA